jgi:hypothetical protein
MWRSISHDVVNLVGDGITRGVTLSLPTELARRLLPVGLELGPQALTEPGTHPLILYFQSISNAHLTVPTLLPSLTYSELVMGVPFSYVTRGPPRSIGRGPFLFMPRLELDNILAMLGGVLFWGYPKRVTAISITERRFMVSGQRGAPMAALDFDPGGELRPIYGYPAFEPIRQIMEQPLVSCLPAGVGPCFACSDYKRSWSVAALRPLSTVLHIGRGLARGLPSGSFAARGIDLSALGSYELRAPWSIGPLYPCSSHG